MKILVVDDNEDARFITAEFLRARGHEVVEGDSARAGLDEAETAAPTVAILDLGLPDMSGYELASLLRSKLPGIQLIAVSGYAADADRERSTAAGFAKHLSKPVAMKTIVDALSELS